MTAIDRFRACLAETLRWEGGWSDHPKDRGGPTMQGIIITVWAGYRGHYVPRGGYRALRQHMGDAAYLALCQDLRRISRADLEAIYRRNYWNLVRGDDLPAGVDLVVFDFAVNSGVSRAVRLLQRLLGLRVDGHMGPATITAANVADPHDLVRAYMAERRAFLKGLQDFPWFGRGWLNRCRAIEPAALAMCGAGGPAVQPTQAAPPPLDDADEQSATQGRATEPEKTAAQSGTVRVATGGAAIGVWQTVTHVNQVAAETRNSGIVDLMAQLASSPQFLIGAALVAGSLYLFRERIAKIVKEGI